MTKVAVVQPLPGIGDMVWHLPHIRALAAHVGQPVTLVAKPRSAADQLFAAEPAVREVVWLDRNPEQRVGRHDGGLGLVRMADALRSRQFDRIYLLHHSKTIALVTRLAGIPERYGYGTGLQRLFLNRGPFLSRHDSRLNPYDQASAYLRLGGIPVQDSEPRLPIDTTVRAAIRQTLRAGSGPIVVIGIGSSEPYKQWGAERFAALADGLAEAGWGRLMLVGGPAEAALADDIAARSSAAPQPVIGWKLAEIAALCAESAFYVGNDTGVLNLAAAVGIPAYGLFGATPPLLHSSRIIAISPEAALSKANGMARITPGQVLAAIRDAT